MEVKLRRFKRGRKSHTISLNNVLQHSLEDTQLENVEELYSPRKRSNLGKTTPLYPKKDVPELSFASLSRSDSNEHSSHRRKSVGVTSPFHVKTKDENYLEYMPNDLDFPIIAILKEKLPWFNDLWKNESFDKQKEVIRLIQASSKNELPVFMKTTVAFNKSNKSPLEKFGSRKSNVALIIGLIDLIRKTKTYIDNIIKVVNRDTKVNYSLLKSNITSIVLDIMGKMDSSLQTIKSKEYYKFICNEIKKYSTTIATSLHVETRFIYFEVPSIISLICTDIIQDIHFNIEKLHSLLETICILSLKGKDITEDECIILLASYSSFYNMLILLSQKISMLSCYRKIGKQHTTKEYTDNKEYTKELLVHSKDLCKSFKYEDRSNWPKGGYSIDALIHDLTVSDNYESTMLKAFISTHQNFISSQSLLWKLISCYHVATIFGDKEKPIQLRICIILKYWIENRFCDFYGQLLQRLIYFINNEITDTYKEMSVLLHRAINVKLQESQNNLKKKINNRCVFIDIDKLPSISILDILEFHSPLEIAKQLTLIDWKLFSEIKNYGLLKRAWDKENLQHRAIAIKRLLQRLDTMSYWIATIIISRTTAIQRSKIIQIFLLISEELKNMNNFNSLAAISVALNISSVSRLKASFSLLSKKFQKILSNLHSLFDPFGSYKLYRSTIKTCVPPLIPYFGLYLSDLLFTDEGNPDYIADNIINFSKYELIYESIQCISMYQQSKYNFEKKEPLFSTLFGLSHLDNDALYEISIIREPRKGTFLF